MEPGIAPLSMTRVLRESPWRMTFNSSAVLVEPDAFGCSDIDTVRDRAEHGDLMLELEKISGLVHVII